MTDPRSGLYGAAYDSLNRLISETDQGGAVVAYARNGQDEVTTYTDPRTLPTTYVRNGFGEVIQETSPDRGVTVPVRDARGLVTQSTDGRGVTTDYTHDAAGRLLAKAFPATPAETIAYSYDATAGGNFGLGRLTGVTEAAGGTAIAYDARGNISSETRGVGAQAYTVGYVWDAADRFAEIIYPSGRIVAYARDAQGRITGVTTRPNSGAAAVTVAAGVTYQPLSRLVSGLTYGNTLTESTTWTLDYEQARCVVQDGPTVHVDATLARADQLNVTGIADAVDPANTQSFGYSAPNRLTSATGPWGTLAWSFDGVGNRTSEVSTPPGGSATTDLYAYPATSNRLMTVTRGAQTVRALTYDRAGNILGDNRLGTPTTYTYNARNRLTSATSGALVWSYAYNAREQLVSRNLDVGGPNLTHFIHDIFGNVIAETNGAGPGGTTRAYIWLPETEIAPTSGSRAQIDRPLGVVSGIGGPSPQLWMVHVDHLNRPVRMTDAGKAVVWNAVWLPWGGVHAITGSAALDARLPGQWYQLEAGLHYNWHRSYDPTLGRYTQPDPLGFVDGPGVYGYAGGSPHVFVDPDGQIISLISRWAKKVWRNIHFEGPGKDYELHGHGRICQVRYKDKYIRLDFDPIKHNLPPSYHLNIGSSKLGKSNYHIPLYTPTSRSPPQ